MPGKASPSTVVSTFLRRYWLVVCSELTLSTEEEEPSYQNARRMLESPTSPKTAVPITFRQQEYTSFRGSKIHIFAYSDLNARKEA